MQDMNNNQRTFEPRLPFYPMSSSSPENNGFVLLSPDGGTLCFSSHLLHFIALVSAAWVWLRAPGGLSGARVDFGVCGLDLSGY